jgi:tetratricopeptide (TPR) repeat protein
MYDYSLYYFMNATNLRPNDSRMWCAQANSYRKLEKIHDAIICYKRARTCDEKDYFALYQMIELYHTLDLNNEKAECLVTLFSQKSLSYDEKESQFLVFFLLLILDFLN